MITLLSALILSWGPSHVRFSPPKVDGASLSRLQKRLTLSTGVQDITPTVSLPLGGYTERQDQKSVLGGDHLYAKTILLSQGKVRVAITSLEMLTVPTSLTEAVRARIPRSVHVLLCATHTHSAPDSQMLNSKMTFKIPGIASFKPYWLGWYADRIANSIDKALSAKPVTVRKVVDETWLADCNRGRRKFAKPDQTAHLIHFETKGGETNLFWYTAHATFYGAKELQTKEDWPGGVGKVGFELIQGALGDVSPFAPGSKGDSPKQKIALFWQEMLMARAHSKSTTVWQPSLGRLGFERLPVSLGKPSANPEFAKTYKISKGLAQLLVTMFAPKEASVSAVTLGKLCLLGAPGEPSSKIGLEMEQKGRAKGYSDCLAISHCNHWIGYLLTPNDYDRGGYEANLNFYGRQSGENVVKAVEKLKPRIKTR